MGKGVRLLSTLLCIALLVVSLPLTAFTLELDVGGSESVGSAAVSTGKGANALSGGESYKALDGVFEVTELRDEQVKHFRTSDGSYVAAEYPYPVHMLDENGEWQDIDNSLSSDGDDYVSGDGRIKFAKKITGKEVLFTLKGSEGKLTFSLNGANKKTLGEVTSLTEGENEGESEGEDSAEDILGKQLSLEKLASSIIYRDILENTDLEYEVISNRIKENIIIKAKSESYEYSFTLKLNGLRAELGSDGAVYVKSLSDDKTVYIIPTPTLVDDSGEYAEDGSAYYSLIEEKKGDYTLTVTAEAEWMNSEERAFPVTLDPPVYVTLPSLMTDLYIDKSFPSNCYSTATVLKVGSPCITYIRYELPTLPDSARVTGAESSFVYGASTNTSGYIGAYEVTSGWDSVLTWSSAESSGVADIGDCLDFVSVSMTAGTAVSEMSFNITSLAKAWYEGGSENYGIAVMPVTDTTFTGMAEIRSSENTEQTVRPYLLISYRNQNGIEDYWSSLSQDAGYAGAGAVDLYTGRLTYAFSGWSTGDSIMPYSPTLVYNSASAGEYVTGSTASGYGWLASFDMSITEKSYAVSSKTSVEYYLYRDADGTEHAFLPYKGTGSTTVYLDEDGLGLTLTEYASVTNGIKYKITTKYDTVYGFNSSGMLYSISDAWGNTRYFNRNSSGKVTSISLKTAEESSATTQLTLTYNSSGMLYSISYSGTAKRLYFYYASTYSGAASSSSSGYLRKIAFYDTVSAATLAEVEYAYTSAGLLTTATDSFSKVRIVYSYSNGKVAQAREHIGSSYTLGARIALSYYDGKTVCRTSGADDSYSNSDDILTHYVFDSSGRVVSTYLTDVNESKVYGSANGSYLETEEPKAQNRIESSVSGGSPQVNYLLNSGFETDSSYWTAVKSTKSLTSEAKSGKNALKLVYSSSSSTSRGGVYQSVTLTEGEYTFSAYLSLSGSGSNATAWIEVTDSTGTTAIAESEKLKNTSAYGTTNTFGYIPITLNFTVTATTTYRFYVRLDTASTAVSLKADNVSLVKADEISSLSLVRDGGFEVTSGTGYTYWTEFATGTVNNTEEVFGDRNSLHLTSLPNTYSFLAQEILLISDTEKAEILANYDSLSLSPETYILSGFGKANSAMLTGNRLFALQARIKYLKSDGTIDEGDLITISFDPSVLTWQYASGAVTTDPEKGYPYMIKVVCAYSYNVGDAYFDNITLTSPISALSYTYDNNGNLTSKRDDTLNQTSSYVYTGSDCVYESHYSDGITVERSYTNHSVISETTNTVDGNTDATYEYDDNGMLIRETLQEGNYVYTTAYEYDYSHIATRGQLVSVTDERGEVTSYYYGSSASNRGLLLAVIGPDGEGNAYSYDGMYRETRVTPASGTPSGGWSAVTDGEEVLYSYTNSDLVGVSTNTTDYGFTYDSYGNRKSVSVGGSDISRYVYNTRGHKLRYIVYANGYTERYDYDELDRVSSVWGYEGGSVSATDSTIKAYSYTKLCEYIYNGDGRLARYNDLITGESLVYDYDLTGRLSSTYRYRLGEDSSGYTSIVFKGVYSCGYDDKGQLTDKVRDYYIGTGGSTRITSTLSAEYDSIGRVTSYSDTGVVTSYSYDSYSTLARASSAYSYLTVERSYGYESVYNDYYGMDVSTSLIDSYTSTVKYSGSTKATSSYTYTYDEAGRITEIRVGGVLKCKYTYDSIGQLVREDNAFSNYSYTYSYDEGGNITERAIYSYTTGTLGSAKFTYSYSYGSSISGDRLTAYRGTSFSYDEIGNPLTYYNGTSYTMTWENGRRLASVVKGTSGSAITYTYDTSGLRLSKTAGSTVTEYAYDGGQLIAERFGSTTIQYMYDAAGTPVGMNYNGTVYLYEKNLQGDVVGIYNTSGTKVASYTYNAWGAIVSSSYESGYYDIYYYNAIRYRGYYYDKETGFYYLQTRYYDPSLCRFVNGDDVDVITATPEGLTDKNLYSYCDNNPVTRVDYGGEFWHWLVGAAVGAIVSGVVSAVSQYIETGEVDIKLVMVDAASGAVSGVVAMTGIGLAGSVAANAAIGAATYVGEQLVTDDEITFEGIVASTIGGGVSGLIGGKGADVNGLKLSWEGAKSGLIREARRANRKYAAKQSAIYIARITAVKSSIRTAFVRTVLSSIGGSWAKSKVGDLE